LLRVVMIFRVPNSTLRVQMVGGAGNAPVVASGFVLRHRFYRPATGTPPGWSR